MSVGPLNLFIAVMAVLWPLWAQARVNLDGVLPADAQNLRRKYPDLDKLTPDYSELDEMLRDLGSTQNYQSIDVIEISENEFLIKAQPLRRIEELIIEGAHALDETAILNAIGLKQGSLFDTSRMTVAAESLQELYGRNGYFNAAIRFTQEAIKPNTLKVTIHIDENQPCRIADVIFESVNQDLARRLERHVRRYRSRIFKEEEIIALERRADEYLRERRYLNAKINQKEARYNEKKTSATLYYTVTDPHSYDVVFEGNQKLSNGDLFRALDLNNFDRASLDPPADIAQRIREYYVASAYPHSRVTHTVTEYEDRYLRQVIVKIEEGEQTRISRIDVSGRISRPPKYYADFIKNNSSDMIEDGYFVRRDLDEGIKNLIVHLNNSGYLRARVQSTRIDFSDDKKQARVSLVLDEGPLTQLRRISFVGNEMFSERELLNVLSIKSNSPLRLNELERSIEALHQFYLQRGHLEMRLENQDDELVQYDEKGAVANITFRIYEGPRISIGSFLIEGNSFTKDRVILRQMELKVGQVLTPEVLEEAKTRLERLSIFSRVELTTVEANTNIAERTLLVRVTEENPGTFRIGFGGSNERELTLRGFTGISYNNLGGSARAISAYANVQNNVVDTKYTEYEIGIGYLEPFVFGTKFRGRVNLSREEKVKDVDEQGELQQLLIERTDSLSFAVERDLTTKIRFSWQIWGIETVKQFDSKDVIQPFEDSKQQIATLGPLIDIDYRDNPFLPTRGTFTRLEATYSSDEFGSSRKIHFARTQGTFSHFLRLFSPKVVWANSFSAGWVKNLSDEENSGVPLSYAFFLGGYSTIRGYSGTEDDRTPNKNELEIKTNRQLVVPDSSTYSLFKSEIRFPIYGWVGGVVFYDAGEVEVKERFAGEYKQSYGAGIRINTPVGPFSVDYARKVSYDPGESPDHWHLYFGTF